MKRDLLSIGQLSRRAKISIDALRFYERLKLIDVTFRSQSGYRYFAPEIVERLLFIRRAKALGFQLDEIRELLTLSDEGPQFKQVVTDILRRKLSTLEGRISRLTAARGGLQGLLKACESRAGGNRGLKEKLQSLLVSVPFDYDDEALPDQGDFSDLPSPGVRRRAANS